MTTASATNGSVAPPKQPRRLGRILVMVLIVAISAIAIVSWLRPPPPRFDLISTQDYERRTKRFAFIQSARAWMTRFSPKVFGFDPVHISASYVVSNGDEQTNLLLQLRKADYSSNSVHVWILASNEVKRAERNLLTDNRSHLRINTSEGIASVLSMTPGFGTLEFANYPKVHGDSVDLAAKVRSVSTHVLAEGTNHEISFRVLLKPGEGGIVIDDSGALFIWAYAP